MANRDQTKIQEKLVTLYMRLNGYFTSGHIVHSPERDQLKSEIDLIGVRFPNHKQIDRGVPSDPNLQTSDDWIDFVICEVKSKGKSKRNNYSLENIDTLEKIILWFGGLSEKSTNETSQNILDEINKKEAHPNKPITVETGEKIRIRLILFGPENNKKRSNQNFFITGPQIIEYISNCLLPNAERENCATRYDYTSWGDFEEIIRIFKENNNDKIVDINFIYKKILGI